MTKIYLFIVLTGTLLFQACINSPSSTLNDLKYFELFRPIIHLNDNQEHVLSDYMTIDQIDSVKSEYYKIEFRENKFFLTTKGNARIFSEIKIYSHGVPYSLPVFRQQDSIALSPINFLELEFHKQSVEIQREATNTCFSYWNNLSLAFDSTNKSYTAEIPPFAKYFDNSHLVTYRINKFGWLELAVAPIKKSKIVTELKDLRQDQVENGIKLSNLLISKRLENNDLMNAFNQELILNPKSLALVYGKNFVVESNDTVLLVEKSYLNEHYLIGFNKSSESFSIKGFKEPIAPFSFIYRVSKGLDKERPI